MIITYLFFEVQAMDGTLVQDVSKIEAGSIMSNDEEHAHRNVSRTGDVTRHGVVREHPD